MDRGERSASNLAPLCHRERSPITFWIWGWVGHRIHTNALESWKVFFSCQQSKPHSPAVQSLVTKPTELSRLHHLHASTADVSVTINCLTRSLVLPHTSPANTAQFWSQPTHFSASTFFIFEARYFSSWFLRPVFGRPFVLGKEFTVSFLQNISKIFSFLRGKKLSADAALNIDSTE